MLYFSMLLLIVVGIGLTIFALIYGIKKNWKLPKAERERSAKKFIIAGFVLYILCKFYGSYTTRENYEADTKRASDIFVQSITFMGQMPELQECKKKLASGELKTHVIAYTDCQEPFVMAAYKKAGVWDKDTLRDISNTWLNIAVKADKGEELSKEEFGASLIKAIRHDRVNQ